MEQYVLMWLLIVVIGTLVGYVILKNLLKTIATFLFIVLLFVVVTGTLTYSDMKSLQTKLESMETAYIFEDNTFVFGIVKSREIYQECVECVAGKDYEEILEQEEYYRVIVMKPEAYEGLHEPEQYIEVIKDVTKTFEQRADAFITLNNAVKNKGVIYMMYEYKKKNVEIFPKTMLFQIITIIPESLITASSSEE